VDGVVEGERWSVLVAEEDLDHQEVEEDHRVEGEGEVAGVVEEVELRIIFRGMGSRKMS
jgi:hypothetical protein